MIIRIFSTIPYRGGVLPVTGRLYTMLQFGFSWPVEMISQEIVIRYIWHSLGSAFILLHNASLPDPSQSSFSGHLEQC